MAMPVRMTIAVSMIVIVMRAHAGAMLHVRDRIARQGALVWRPGIFNARAEPPPG
jgi:hypothetical protein